MGKQAHTKDLPTARDAHETLLGSTGYQENANWKYRWDTTTYLLQWRASEIPSAGTDGQLKVNIMPEGL